MDRVTLGRCLLQVAEQQHPDEEIAVCGAGKMLVEQARLEQARQPNEEVRSLNVWVPGEEVVDGQTRRDGLPPRPLRGLLMAEDPAPHEVSCRSTRGPGALGEMCSRPGVVVVEGRDVDVLPVGQATRHLVD